FFSSRRRHTRFSRDWSSDVCSSDLLFVGALSLTLVLATDPVRLMASLHEHARLPATWTYAVLAAHRLLTELPEAWHTIRCAQAVRDPRRRPGALPRSPRALGAAAFALLVGAVRRAERLTVALESRGLGSGPPASSPPLPLGPAALVAPGVAPAGARAVVVVGVRAGWVTGIGALTACARRGPGRAGGASRGSATTRSARTATDDAGRVTPSGRQPPAGTTRGRRSSAGGSHVVASASTCSPERMSLTWSGVRAPSSSTRPGNHTNGMPRRSA